MIKPLLFALLSGLWLASAPAGAQGVADRPASPRAGTHPKAQLAVDGVNEASLYVAHLRRCQALDARRKAACVEAARR